jgi:hypothetical protein
MPAPPEESEPAMVSAMGIVIVLFATRAPFQGGVPVVTRPAIGSKLTYTLY